MSHLKVARTHLLYAPSFAIFAPHHHSNTIYTFAAQQNYRHRKSVFIFPFIDWLHVPAERLLGLWSRPTHDIARDATNIATWRRRRRQRRRRTRHAETYRPTSSAVKTWRRLKVWTQARYADVVADPGWWCQIGSWGAQMKIYLGKCEYNLLSRSRVEEGRACYFFVQRLLWWLVCATLFSALGNSEFPLWGLMCVCDRTLTHKVNHPRVYTIYTARDVVYKYVL